MVLVDFHTREVLSVLPLLSRSLFLPFPHIVSFIIQHLPLSLPLPYLYLPALLVEAWFSSVPP